MVLLVLIAADVQAVLDVQETVEIVVTILQEALVMHYQLSYKKMILLC